ncbi:Ureidoglycolate lyase [Toensbergia leucococca]|nr:Ureidoglycolate lyase [Toensbergia leucococca]
MPLDLQVLPLILPAQPLSSAAFKHFGYVVENPRNLSSTILRQQSQLQSNAAPKPTSANQGTALKYSDISPVFNLYHAAPGQKTSKTAMSMFVCSPRQLRSITSRDGPSIPYTQKLLGVVDLTIMERHSYTTQTFIPMGLDPQDVTTCYLVVVAPTLPDSYNDAGMPDISNVRAFIANGSQAVTYGAGTWHAPMIVIGKHHIDFVVVQHVNGVPEDDCQEVELIGVRDNGVKIAVPQDFTSGFGKVSNILIKSQL